MKQQPEDREPFDDMRSGINLLYFVLIAHATCITPFIRHSFGSNIPGFIGIASMFMMFFATAGLEDINILRMMELWFLILICHRMRMWWMSFRGWVEHSFYAGWPWLAMMLFRTKDEIRAKHFEPLICLIVGLVIFPFSQGLGAFVFFGFISLSITRTMQFAARRRQVVALQDLEIEQRNLSERLRGTRKDF